MSEDKAGKVIQYYWEGERFHQRLTTVVVDEINARSHPSGVCARPLVGFSWRYFENSDYNRAQLKKHKATNMTTLVTEGAVVSWNKRTGIVLTDAGEILIRG